MPCHSLRRAAVLRRCSSGRLLFGLLALLISVATLDRHAFAQGSEYYRLAAQEAGSEVYALGVGIASLVKLNVLPAEAVDLDVTITSGFLESFVLINRGDAHFGLLKANWDDLVGGDRGSTQAGGNHKVQTIATLKREGEQSTKLVARSDVDEAVVYEVTKAIFENLPFLRQIDGSLDETLLDTAALDGSLPMHRGARRYYDEIAASPPIQADDAPDDAPVLQEARTFIIYFDLDKSEINKEGLGTLDELKDFAESLDEPKVWIAGYTDTTGSGDYNLDLAKRRADAVLLELRDRKVAARNLDLTAFGERSPWVVTADQVNESRNRRVEVLVEPGANSVVIGRAERQAGAGDDPDRGRETAPEN